MSRTLTPVDVHVIMNALVKEATGQQNAIQVVDTSTFISAGETVLATGVENTLNSLAIVFGRTLMAVRPYKAKLAIINALNTGAYTSRIRKQSFYSREAEASGDWNTQLYENLAMGFDNGQNPSGGNPQSTESMWLQNQPVPLEVYFGGQSVWQDSATIYENQIAPAFRDEREFARFAEGVLTERGNDIESQKEAFNRALILNHIAAIIGDMGANMPGSRINLTAGYNQTFSTSYTSQDLRTTYRESFLKYFVSTFKLTSDYLTHRSARYHYSPAKTVKGVNYTLLRHTPKDRQKAIMFNPFFVESQAWVMPQIFNPEYLKLENFEGVDFWQNENAGANIDVTPAITDPVTGQVAKGTEVKDVYVLGMIFDEDALMMDYQLEAANTTPLEARKRYRNIWWTFSRNPIADFTENAVVFYMAD